MIAEHVSILAAFGVIALAARQIGPMVNRARLPLITGFLLTGIVAGPYMLGLLSVEVTERLRYLDEAALAFIAFAAGAELYLREFRSRFRSIGWVTAGLVASTFTLTSTTLFLLSDAVPFMRDLPPAGRLAVSLLAGSVLVARSPSSAIAVVNELRARGPFTRTALGVTVAMDVVVILLFAVCSSLAATLVAGAHFDLSSIAHVVAEIAVSIGLGVAIGRFLPYIARMRAQVFWKAFLIITTGWAVFEASRLLREWTNANGPFPVLLEPLLICMIAGFVVANRSGYRTEFQRVLDYAGPPVYVVFFTLTGASLAIDVLADTWMIGLALFGVRLMAIAIGAFLGGAAAGEPMRFNRIGWMSFITQAGIGLGLAKEVAVEFESWGAAFATVIISVIVVNQVVGPPMFKWALHLAGEAHVRAGKRDLRGTPSAYLFGLETQTLALARQLEAHGWRVVVVTQASVPAPLDASAITVQTIETLDVASLKAIGTDGAQAIVALMPEAENLQLCEIAFEHFGTRTLIVRSDNRDAWDQYHDLGATIVDPGVAMVSLLDHFVRSPTMASLLLGTEPDQDVVDLEVQNRDLHGMALRDLRLPLDTLILSVRRSGASLISHGYTQLEQGDRVTLVGSPSSIAQVTLRFEA